MGGRIGLDAGRDNRGGMNTGGEGRSGKNSGSTFAKAMRALGTRMSVLPLEA